MHLSPQPVQIKDILKGALRFNQSQLEAEENEEISIADDHYTIASNAAAAAAAAASAASAATATGERPPTSSLPGRESERDRSLSVEDEEEEEEEEKEEVKDPQVHTPQEKQVRRVRIVPQTTLCFCIDIWRFVFH